MYSHIRLFNICNILILTMLDIFMIKSNMISCSNSISIRSHTPCIQCNTCVIIFMSFICIYISTTADAALTALTPSQVAAHLSSAMLTTYYNVEDPEHILIKDGDIYNVDQFDPLVNDLRPLVGKDGTVDYYFANGAKIYLEDHDDQDSSNDTLVLKYGIVLSSTGDNITRLNPSTGGSTILMDDRVGMIDPETTPYADQPGHSIFMDIDVTSGIVVLSDPDDLIYSGASHQSIGGWYTEDDDKMQFNILKGATLAVEGNIRVALDDAKSQNFYNIYGEENLIDFNNERGGKLILKPKPSAAKASLTDWSYIGVRIDGGELEMTSDNDSYILRVYGRIGSRTPVHKMTVNSGSVVLNADLHAKVYLTGDPSILLSEADIMPVSGTDSPLYSGFIVPDSNKTGKVIFTLSDIISNMAYGSSSNMLGSIELKATNSKYNDKSTTFNKEIYTGTMRIQGDTVNFRNTVHVPDGITLTSDSIVEFQSDSELSYSSVYAAENSSNLSVVFRDTAGVTGTDIDLGDTSGSETNFYDNVRFKNTSLVSENISVNGTISYIGDTSLRASSILYNNAQADAYGTIDVSTNSFTLSDSVVNIMNVPSSKVIYDIAANSNISDSTGSLISVVSSNYVAPAVTFSHGEVIFIRKDSQIYLNSSLFIDSSTADNTLSNFVSLEDNIFASYKWDTSDSNVIKIVATPKSDASVMDELGLSEDQVLLLQNLLRAAVNDDDSKVMSDVNSLLTSDLSSDDKKELSGLFVNQLTPDKGVLNSMRYSSSSVMNVNVGIVSDRILSTRTGGASGISTGSSARGFGSTWLKTGWKYTRDSGDYGYKESGPYGIAGIDHEFLSGRVRLGTSIGISYLTTKNTRAIGESSDVTLSGNAGGNISSEQIGIPISVYSTIDITRSVYMIWAVSYSSNNMKYKRYISSQDEEYVATAEYTKNSYLGRVGIGGTIPFTLASDFQYLLSFDQQKVDGNQFSEDGAGAFNVTVDDPEFSLSTVGLKGTWSFGRKSYGSIGSIFRVMLGVSYDTNISDSTQRVWFAGSTDQVFDSQLEEQRDRTAVIGGVGIDFKGATHSMSADYSVESRGGVLSHDVMLSMRKIF